MTPRPLLSALVVLAAAPALAQDGASDADVVAALARRADQISRRATPSVVSVTAATDARAPTLTVLPGLIVAPPARESERLEATGFFVEPGVVATTYEIARQTARFEVRLPGGETRTAALLGADETFRVALLRVDAPADVVALDDPASPAEAGRRAVAWLVTTGPTGAAEPQIAVVRTATCSQTPYDRYLCAPLCLQPGAAGAPLLADDGRLLGMAVGAVADAASPPSHSQHCRSTLFIRADDVLAAAKEIARTGRVRHARIGVLLDGDTNRVDQLIPGGPAELAGLREGDTIVAVGGAPVGHATDVTRALLRRRLGDSVPVEATRSGAVVQVRVTVNEVSMPPVPATPPVAGTVLRWSWSETPAGTPTEQRVHVQSVDAESAAGAAGLAAGDEVLRIDGTGVLQYLTRHRMRPGGAAPAEIVVRRGETELRLSPRAR
jgi:S1-C subfamily serine protease